MWWKNVYQGDKRIVKDRERRYAYEVKQIEELSKHLLSIGCEVWQGLTPDNNPTEIPIDLVFYREDIGGVGVVIKDIVSIRQGKVFAEVITRIQNKYKKATYDGDKISTWCVFVPSISLSYLGSEVNKVMKEFLIQFLNEMYGVSVLTFDGDDCIIDRIKLEEQDGK